jgi:DNA-binding MarR family transcriptional regulator
MPAAPLEEFATTLSHAKNASWAQVLLKCARLLNERALTLVQQRTKQHVRPAHTALFPQIDLQGTRPSVLAERLGISKQAVGQLVDDLMKMGLLDQAADPADGRARLVKFSARGKKGLLTGLATLLELEAQLSATVGKADVAQMHKTLLRLLATLENATGS